MSAYRMRRVLVLPGEAAPSLKSGGWMCHCHQLGLTVLLSCVVRLHHWVSLDVFIDDSHQSAQGTPREARKLIVPAGRTFTKEAQKHLRGRFAEKRTAIVSSQAHLLGLQAEAVKTKTVGLGVDVSAGKARAATTATRKRLLAAFLWKATLQAPARPRTSTSVVCIQLQYGDEVSDVSDG